MNKENVENNVKKYLEAGYEAAREILTDGEKMDEFLLKLEDLLQKVPVAGGTLAVLPVWASLLKYYAKGEYGPVPTSTLVVIVCGFFYLLKPGDLIPDFLPGLGQMDDLFVIAVCEKLAGEEVDRFKAWRDGQEA